MAHTYTLDEFARMIDHTNLHADARRADMERLCREAREHHFKMVAINSVQTALAAELLAGTDIHVGAAIAFPLGQMSIAAKVFECTAAIADGATEIDYVVNLTAVRDGDWDLVRREMEAMVGACRRASTGRPEPIPCKVIFENCLITDEEKIRLCEIASEVKPTFIKTSTGFSTGGATVADVALMRAHVADDVQVKAAGGIRDAETFLAMVRAGAARIGTSAGVAIIDELKRMMEAAGTDTLEV